MSDRFVARTLAGLCVILALICLDLAIAYGRKTEQVRCYAEAVEIGLSPPQSCDEPARLRR